MSVSTFPLGDASAETQDNTHRHGRWNADQINWEEIEKAWQAWTAADQARAWHGPNADRRGNHEQHQDLANAHYGDADSERQARDGMDLKHQRPPDADDGALGHEDGREQHLGDGHRDQKPEADERVQEAQDGCDHEHGGQPRGPDDNHAEEHGPEGEHEHHRGLGEGAEDACDKLTDDTGPAQGLQPDEHQQQELTQDAHHAESEVADADGVQEARDDADPEHQGAPNDDDTMNADGHDGNEHSRHHGSDHVRSEEACEDGHGDTDTTWSDTLNWSDMSTWGDVRPAPPDGHVPDMSPEDMDFVSDDSRNSSSPAEAHSSCLEEHGTDGNVCPAPTADHWHALL